MPPVGLEYFNPIINNLSEEVSKINNLLPKIFDIKSEVCNTADSVRNIKLQLSGLENKFSNHIIREKTI